MNTAIIRPVLVHDESNPWPQRIATLLCVLVLHASIVAALIALRHQAPLQYATPTMTVQWIPSQPTRPQAPQATPQPEQKKQTPTPPQNPTEAPHVKPVETPLLQASADAVAVSETTKAPATPPALAAVAAAQPVAQTSTTPAAPIDPTLKPEVDCTQSPEPVYPTASMKLVEEGTVLLRIQVDERGRPLRVEIESSSKYGRLDRAARDTVATSWICPLRQGKRGFSGWLHVPIKFVIPPL